jgi:hypothetical protein
MKTLPRVVIDAGFWAFWLAVAGVWAWVYIIETDVRNSAKAEQTERLQSMTIETRCMGGIEHYYWDSHDITVFKVKYNGDGTVSTCEEI